MPSIAFVSNTSWSMYNFRGRLLKSLVEKGHDVYVIAPRDKYSSKIESELGCRYIELPLSGKSVNPFLEVKYFWKLFRLYQKQNFDLIFHYTVKPVIYGSLAARLATVPSIAVVTGLGYAFLRKNYVTFFVKLLYRLSLRNPCKVWFLNESDLQSFVSCNLIEKDRAVLLPGEGVDINHFSPSKEGVGNAPFAFLLVARMLFDKGVLEYVKAAMRLHQKYPDIKFQLLGPRDSENPSLIPGNLIDHWVECGHVEYLGSCEDVRPYITNSSCVVLPSYREGLSRVLLEAAAMGKPIVTTDVPGCREIVLPDISGYLCKAQNVEELCHAMEKIILLSNKERDAMGERAREHVVYNYADSHVLEFYTCEISKIYKDS